MSYFRRVIDCLGRWLKALFYDPTGTFLDNGRLLAYLAFSLLCVAVWHNMDLKQEIHLDQLGQGLGVVLTALVVYVYHDRKVNSNSNADQ